MTQTVTDDPELSELIEKLRQQDQADWTAYELSLSLAERKLRNGAMRNLRMTKHHIFNSAHEYSPEPLTELEASNHLRALRDMVSQIEHFSFEGLREARKAKKASYATLVVAVLIFLALICLIVLK